MSHARQVESDQDVFPDGVDLSRPQEHPSGRHVQTTRHPERLQALELYGDLDPQPGRGPLGGDAVLQHPQFQEAGQEAQRAPLVQRSRVQQLAQRVSAVADGHELLEPARQRPAKQPVPKDREHLDGAVRRADGLSQGRDLVQPADAFHEERLVRPGDLGRRRPRPRRQLQFEVSLVPPQHPIDRRLALSGTLHGIRDPPLQEQDFTPPCFARQTQGARPALGFQDLNDVGEPHDIQAPPHHRGLRRNRSPASLEAAQDVPHPRQHLLAAHRLDQVILRPQL